MAWAFMAASGRFSLIFTDDGTGDGAAEAKTPTTQNTRKKFIRGKEDSSRAEPD